MAIWGSSMAKVQRLKFEINGLLIKEEKMWKQRSRAQWWHEGDKNTRYFQSQANVKWLTKSQTSSIYYYYYYYVMEAWRILSLMNRN